jgi:hypothetical protein
VAGLGQDAFVGREAPSADTERDEAPVIRGEEPDKAGPAVGAAGWVVRVNEPGERDAVLLLGGGQGVGVAEQTRLDDALGSARGPRL